MEHLGKGKFNQVSGHREVQLARDDTYLAVVAMAAGALKLKDLGALSLFRQNGTVILNGSLTVKGARKPWTIGNYLLAIKKSAHQIKLGVGHSTEDPDSPCKCIVVKCIGMQILKLSFKH